MNRLIRTWLKIKTFILMCMPLSFYLWMLKKVSVDRLQDYSGILGNNPKSLIVADGIVLVDLEDMQI